MDIGGFRDMHRHRRCVQLLQPYTGLHGFEEPICPGQPTLAQAGLADTYTAAMDAAHAAYRAASTGRHSDPEPGAPHLASERKSTRLNSSHRCISYAVFCLKKKN